MAKTPATTLNEPREITAARAHAYAQVAAYGLAPPEHVPAVQQLLLQMPGHPHSLDVSSFRGPVRGLPRTDAVLAAWMTPPPAGVYAQVSAPAAAGPVLHKIVYQGWPAEYVKEE